MGECLPCIQHADCTSRWGLGSKCLSYGGDGSFCSRECEEETHECPAGQRCQVTKGDDEIVYWCIPIDPSASCKCDTGAVFETRWTTCERANTSGVCPGARFCATDGLSDCDAQTPAPETCNGLDDDCDELIDEGFEDFDNDSIKDCIDTDDDADQVPDEVDNCLFKKNSSQTDFDGDGVGDECDADADGDSVQNIEDCEPFNAGIHPGAAEVCDGLDNNCNGQKDEDSCDDNNPCTVGLCSAEFKCEYQFTTSPCNDNNLCTSPDRCADGSCLGTEVTDCDDNDPCTIDFCEPWSGCKHQLHADVCDDGNACTLDGACVNGACEPGKPLECDDDNPCTTDFCDPLTPEGCVSEKHSDPCNDEDACTADDVCIDGACVGATVDCDDGNICTVEFCNHPQGCVFLALAGAACDDGTKCLLLDQCTVDGDCVGQLDLDCDDGDACTTDTCNDGIGCEHAIVDTCDDGDACTLNWCDSLTGCQTETLDCNDANPCTNDTCNPITGCSWKNSTDPCVDGDECTAPDTCSGGECIPGAPVTCDDGNNCTTDVCQPAAGCFNLNNEVPCTDGNKCTNNDKCLEGSCKSGSPLPCNDGNQCTINGCNPLSGCTLSYSVGPCNDGNGCTVNDTCNGSGKCIGTDKICADGNQCTVDHCDQPYDCVFLPVEKLPCTDGNACTDGDKCNKKGQCVSGSSLICDDKNPCTEDACTIFGGCTFDTIPGCF